MSALGPTTAVVEDTIAPEAHATWSVLCSLIDAFETSANLADGERCNQIFIPMQAAMADLMSYYQTLANSLINGVKVAG